MRSFLGIALLGLGLQVWLTCPLRAAIPAAPDWKDGKGYRWRVLAVDSTPAATATGFTDVSASRVGLSFTNVFDDRSLLQNYNLMLGSGVAAGDFDGDGWCDLYFCSILGSNSLFRNRGDGKFEETTAKAGVARPGRTNTGAAFADLDGDGRLDLLVTSLGCGVALFLNNGDGSFRDATLGSGLATNSGSLSMALGDVDGDGDLDLYVCNYGATSPARNGTEFLVRTVDGKPSIHGPGAERLRIVRGKIVELGEPDVLYRNEGGGRFRAVPWDSPFFLDEAGKPLPAPWDYGLSAQFHDVNGDGAPDLYVCNDFDTPDRFWINDGRGHFRLIPRLAQRVQSYASMGVDFADVDRDGHPDFLVVEMLSPGHARRLRQRLPQLAWPALPGVPEDRSQIGRNTLFRSQGDGTFVELANWAGVAASDWSWQGAFLDVDLDGFDDLLVVNGNRFDVQDLDAQGDGRQSLRASLGAAPRLFTPNCAWRNAGHFRFDDVSTAWGFAHTNVAQGLALADLDNDGDLDAVINCLGTPPLLLRNETVAPRIAVRLRGIPPNTRGIGARITVRGGALPAQTQEMRCGGKYLSSDEPMRVFAAGSNTMTIEVAWRRGTTSSVLGARAGGIYEIEEQVATPSTAPVLSPAPPKPQPLFTEAGDGLRHTHHELPCDDFQLQPLLPRKLSQRGPGLCVIDLDGDGHEDLVIGAGRGGRISWHRGDGRGNFQLAAVSQPVEDDVLALVEWTPAPGGRTVLATLADNETVATNPPLRLVTFGKEGLLCQPVPAPEFTDNPSVGFCLAVADYDGDGDLDVFIGAHAVPGRYPEAARSRLFRNDAGSLHLDRENTGQLGGGLVNAALWTDLDGDGWPELALACEWGAIRVFKNTRGVLREGTAELGLAPITGWWTGLAAADFDGDGRLDLIAGNWGLNGPERASSRQPARLFHGPFLRSDSVDLLESEYDGARLEALPSRGLEEVANALPMLRERFGTHHAWSLATVREVLSPFREVREVSAATLATTIFLNRGARFEARPLPDEAQWAPAWGVVAADFDGDGRMDVFLSQNFFAVAPHHERLDAGRGLWLSGDGRGGFRAATGSDSGVGLSGEQRAVVTGDFNEDGLADLVVTQNGGPTRRFLNAAGQRGWRVHLAGPPGNPRGIGAALWATAGEQRGPVQEVHGGSGWLSHNSTTLVLARTAAASRLHVRWPGGRRSTLALTNAAQDVAVRFADAEGP